jgi:hypothetical protein
MTCLNHDASEHPRAGMLVLPVAASQSLNSEVVRFTLQTDGTQPIHCDQRTTGTVLPR